MYQIGVGGGGLAILGSQLAAGQLSGPVGAAANTLLAVTGLAFGLYMVVALVLITLGAILTRLSGKRS
jgi:hypothetical protein